MAQFNENIKIVAPNPIDDRYLSLRTSAGAQLPYSGTSEVFGATGIPSTQRYVGQTVLVKTGSTSPVEYWFRDNITTLVEKKFASEQVVGDFITGATNLGFFSGTTGIQTLALSGFPTSPTTFDGLYNSEYQWYYADSGGKIRIGSLTQDTPLRRAYIKTNRSASWIWNVGTSSWILSYNDVAANVGNPTIPYTYAGTPYTQTTWVTGFQSNGSTSITGSGGLNTGTTEVTVGNPVFNDKSNQELHLRTIINDSPNFLKIDTDENYIHFSGISSLTTATNYGSGIGVYSGVTGTNLKFRTLVASGDTTITTKSDGKLVIYSSSDGSANALTGATNVGTGVGFYSGTTDRNMQFRTIVGTGDTIITTNGDTIIVDSTGAGGVYNLASPSAIEVGGISGGTVLTGKTSFQLWEALLVPELCGTVTEPYITSVGLTCSGLVEIDTTISQTVTLNFCRGLIHEQYLSVSPYRTAGANAYCFTGPEDMPVGFQTCTALSAAATDASYDVVIGTQTWGGYTRYDAGNAALSNKGNIYCAALTSGCTNALTNSIVGVYPLYATTSSITTPTAQGLENMSSATLIQIPLLGEIGGKQKFEIPCAWLGIPTNKPLQGVQQYTEPPINSWDYPGGSAAASLNIWDKTPATETVQGNSVGYCRYTYNGADRNAVLIRLVF